MNTPRILLLLTLANLALLACQVLPSRRAEAADGLLRGRGLEIVDDQGRPRCTLTIAPADPDFKMPDGTRGYGETVIFRLITADGKPRVKLTTSDDGSGLMLLGSTDTTYSILHSSGAQSSLKLRNDEKTQQVLKP